MNLDEIKNLCVASNIGIEEVERHSGRKSLIIKLPKEREYTFLYAHGGRTEEVFSEIPEFTKYRFVKGYEAIWSIDDDYLECEVSAPFMGMLLRRFGDENSGGEEEQGEILTIPSPIDGAEIELSSASKYFLYLSALKEEFPRIPFKYIRSKNAVTFKIKNFGLKQHSDAILVVTKIFAAICFQINVSANIPIQLEPERFPREQGFRREEERLELPVARYEYDIEPLSMYWNAENMMGMPLQGYFSYYQAIEYYFTIYSLEEAQRNIRNLLKDPRFNVDKDKDLSKIMNIVKYNNSSSSFGNELSQLKATLKSCVNFEEVKNWLNEDTKRKEYFVSNPAKKISKTTLNPSQSDDELLDSIAKRVYEIRCRIVHTKGTDDNVEVLHPFSYHSNKLKHELALISMLCIKVIIANGRPM
jgi:hypothetical protein